MQTKSVLRKAIQRGSSAIALFAFACALFFSHASSSRDELKSSSPQIAKLAALTLESSCFTATRAPLEGTKAQDFQTPVYDLLGLQSEQVTFSIPKITFLENARSYQYFRLNVLSSQHHPPTLAQI